MLPAFGIVYEFRFCVRTFIILIARLAYRMQHPSGYDTKHYYENNKGAYIRTNYLLGEKLLEMKGIPLLFIDVIIFIYNSKYRYNFDHRFIYLTT